MPELPEVEVVRAGLAPAITGARIVAVEIRDERSLKRHADTRGSFESLISGAVALQPVRRGKFLWVPLRSRSDDIPTALLMHLGMSGQVLVREVTAPDDRHVRVRIWVEHPEAGELRIDFADQRIFGSLAIDTLVPTPDDGPGGFGSAEPLIPSQVTHIARDILDPLFDPKLFHNRLHSSQSGVKRLLLNQQIVSGVGNIYADEALWAARIHPETPGARLTFSRSSALVAALQEVMRRALAEGGTSFDEQYVNVNGQAGYFEHSLRAYGREGEPCERCAQPIRRFRFMNRSSHVCTTCQRLPRKL